MDAAGAGIIGELEGAAADYSTLVCAQSSVLGDLVYCDTPSPHLSCAICMGAVVDDPCTLQRCDHIFCRTCLLHALGNDRRCPICRTAACLCGRLDCVRDPLVHTLVKTARVVGLFVDELRVYCQHGVKRIEGVLVLDRNGCRAKPRRDELRRHYATCEFEKTRRLTRSLSKQTNEMNP